MPSKIENAVSFIKETVLDGESTEFRFGAIRAEVSLPSGECHVFYERQDPVTTTVKSVMSVQEAQAFAKWVSKLYL